MNTLKLNDYNLTSLNDQEMLLLNGGGLFDSLIKLVEAVGLIDAITDSAKGFVDGFKAGYNKRSHGAGGSW